MAAASSVLISVYIKTFPPLKHAAAPHLIHWNGANDCGQALLYFVFDNRFKIKYTYPQNKRSYR